jgi:phytoene dehydrogenase-like protein
MMHEEREAVVVGSGPNGLAAAITISQAGHAVLIFEAQDTIGGSARTAELTLPGFLHDICSAIHPLAAASPCFTRMPLSKYGLDWIFSPAAVAHPLDDGTAVVLERSVEDTASGLGRDGPAYFRLMRPLVEFWPMLKSEILGPFRVPKHPFRMARFGRHALRAATSLAHSRFRGERARSLFAGIAAHSVLPLETRPSAAVGLVLGIAGHAGGWPFPRGGSRTIVTALAAYFESLGGLIRTGARVDALAELPPVRAVLCDITPRQLLKLAAPELPASFQKKLAGYRYGPGVFKLDWALDGPIPWRAPECSRAATVHVGGSLEEIAFAEREPWEGRCAERPFVLVAQQSLFDPSRAPSGKHTGWAYCHVPNGSTTDMTERIERQIERFAPGFRDRILARHKLATADLERRNANLVGGDINGGVQDLRQLFTRPTIRTYATPRKGLYLCSASTPPGGGVHGMCGYFGALAALKGCFA